MSAASTKFNLRPQERRLVAFVGLILFVVLNMVFVWPHFSDWGAQELKQQRAQRSLDMYQRELTRVPGYRVKLRELEHAGSSVVPDEQELDLVRTVNNYAQLNRLNVISADPRPRINTTGQTNSFFEEQYEMLHATSGNEELVNFLMSLTTTNSLIRVKDLRVKPDAGGTRLDANMTLVASYQRRAPARPLAGTGSAVTNAPAKIPAPTAARTPLRAGNPSLKSSGPTNRITTLKARPTNNPTRKP